MGKCVLCVDDTCLIKKGKEFKELLQGLIGFGWVQIYKPRKKEEIAMVHGENGKDTKPPRPLIIHFDPVANALKPLVVQVQSPFPYKNSKVIPWKYDVMVQPKTPIVMNIAKTRGEITKSGRVYTPKYMWKKNPTKGKHVEILPETRKKKKQTTLIERIARLQVALTEYDIIHVTQKAIKRSVLAEYLAHNPLTDYQPMRQEFSNEDIMVVLED
ncbi:hypothetical protein CR513_29027, partial [Mucuna pruriens]